MVTPTSPTDPCHQHNHAQEGQNILSTSSVEYLEHFRQHDQEKKQNQNEKYSIDYIFAAFIDYKWKSASIQCTYQVLYKQRSYGAHQLKTVIKSMYCGQHL